MSIILRASSIFGAAKSLLTKRNFVFGDVKKNLTVEIDTVLSWEVSSGKSITEMPLEVGAGINDHTYLNPTSAIVTISESKFGNVLDQINSIANSFREVDVDNISKDVLSNNLSFYQSTKASKKLEEIYAILEDLEITFILALPNGTYNNMVLQSVIPTGDTTTQGGFNATLTFKQVNLIGELDSLGIMSYSGFKEKLDVSASVSSFVNGKLGR